jgi:hypothetical protein
MLLRAARPQTAARFAAVRPYSVQAPKLSDVDPSKMVIQRTQTPGVMMKEEELVFGRTFTGEFFQKSPAFSSRHTHQLPAILHNSIPRGKGKTNVY